MWSARQREVNVLIIAPPFYSLPAVNWNCPLSFDLGKWPLSTTVSDLCDLCPTLKTKKNSLITLYIRPLSHFPTPVLLLQAIGNVGSKAQSTNRCSLHPSCPLGGGHTAFESLLTGLWANMHSFNTQLALCT